MPRFELILRHICSVVTGVLLSLPFVGYVVDLFTLMMVDLLRLWCARGVATGVEKCKRPQMPLQLYEFEGCPFCRKVRETLTVLDIDHVVYPCPRETLRAYGQVVNSRFRPEVMKAGGKLQFPFLVDGNTGVKMFESDEIVSYLWKTYGSEAVQGWRFKWANNPTYWKFSMKMISFMRPRGEMGILRAVSKRPPRPLELWGYESSPFVRRVREILASLELPYYYHVVAAGSKQKREAFSKEHADKLSNMRKKFNLIQVPFMKDPNSGIELFESADIVHYLRTNYQTAPVAKDSWLEYGIHDKKKE